MVKEVLNLYSLLFISLSETENMRSKGPWREIVLLNGEESMEMNTFIIHQYAT